MHACMRDFLHHPAAQMHPTRPLASHARTYVRTCNTKFCIRESAYVCYADKRLGYVRKHMHTYPHANPYDT